MTNILWDNEKPITELLPDFDVPSWLEADISPSDVAAIVQGGCDSGAYMPACTYHQALKTMSEQGDDVLQYIQEALGELPKFSDDTSWAGMACFYLSTAVELWASSVEQELTDALEEMDCAA